MDKYDIVAASTFTYGGLALLIWQTNWIIGLAVFLMIWGFFIWNNKE